MICGVTGAECLKEKCRQFTSLEECTLVRRLGTFLHHPQSLSDTSKFFNFLEELRPYGNGR